MRKELVNEIQDINKTLSDIKHENQKRIDWAKNLGFFNVKVEVNQDLVNLAEAFTHTDNFPRLTWDNNFVIIAVNDKFLVELGYDKEDLIGEKIIDEKGESKFIASKYIIDSIEVVTKNVKAGIEMLEGIENEWYAKDGSLVEIEWFKGFNHPEFGIGSTQCEFKIKK